MAYTTKEELTRQISVLEKELAEVKKAKTGWMVACIVVLAVALIAIAIVMAR